MYNDKREWTVWLTVTLCYQPTSHVAMKVVATFRADELVGSLTGQDTTAEDTEQPADSTPSTPCVCLCVCEHS